MGSVELKRQLAVGIDDLRNNPGWIEERVKQYVIEPILENLGWNTHAKDQAEREHKIGKGKVDYALFDQRGQKQVFIEAKRLGFADDPKYREQLFGYARDVPAPILVLTDGQLWEFYFSRGPGSWEERRFHRLSLDDDCDLSIQADFLTRYLGKEAVCSGEARRSADDLLEKQQAFEFAKQELPSVWRVLLRDPSPELRDLLRERVRAKCGSEPRSDDIDSFFKEVSDAGRWQTHGRKEEPLMDPPVPMAPATTTNSSHRLTPQGDFQQPVLQVLIDKLDGRGKRKQIIDGLAEVMESRLGDHDREKDKYGRIRWNHTVDSLLQSMRRTGLLKSQSESRKGEWEVSDQGRSTYWNQQR